MVSTVALALWTGVIGSQVWADPPSKDSPKSGQTVHAAFFGEGGSYHEPSQDAKQYLEQAPDAPARTPSARPDAPPPPAPKKPQDAFLRKDPASLRYDEIK